MTPHGGTGPERGEVPATLVWIDAEEALIVRWEGAARVERLVSGLPAVHGDHRTRRDRPGFRAGPSEERLARERVACLRAFVRSVAEHVPARDDVRIVGPGAVRQRLGRLIRQQDRVAGRRRAVDTRAAGVLTERRLVAHVRELAGDPPPRVVRGS